MKKNKYDIDVDKVAPGIDDDEELNEKATSSEVAEGESTKVVTLSNDEVDPS
ncbi:hypothetical protein [Metabacillus malikii]|uniref:DUF4025 domain-containing protein n=1 Tax=Metabacillus malikii TaxID=1504265 RepID=A0ABT9ZBN6_9BACI|nr:hypothetical protein [Metabacillus malikii]MDQ0229658.1 hypothetical protein [Metabacillus malikii]